MSGTSVSSFSVNINGGNTIVINPENGAGPSITISLPDSQYVSPGTRYYVYTQFRNGS